MTIPVIILGAGGHANVLISVLKTGKIDILGITDLVTAKVGDHINGNPVLGQEDIIFRYLPDSILLVNGIGSVGSTTKRGTIYEKFKNHGYSFISVIHPSAIIMDEVQLGEGVQIMAGAIVQTGCTIGDNAIINTGAIIDHDCIIGAHVHVASGAVLSGGVEVGVMSHIGTSATVIQGIKIGAGSIIGAGAVIIKDIPSGVKAFGVPARIRG